MSGSIPTKQRALWLPAAHAQFVVGSADVPKPGSGEVLIREEAVALNPVDYMVQDSGVFVTKYPTILGWEGAGVVVQVGEGVESVAVGDKVLHPGRIDYPNSTFMQYVTIPAYITAKIPPNITFDQAAAVPLALDTAALGLYAPPGERGGAGLTSPWEAGGRGKYAGQPILILGGASSVGQFAIQLAKLSGFSPIVATSSPRNFEYLKSLGATHVVDRNLTPSSISEAVKEITDRPYQLVFDAVSFEDTQNSGYDLLAPGGTIVVVTSIKIAESKRTPDKRITHIFGDPTMPDRREIAVDMYKSLPTLLETGELKPNRVEVISYGLAGITGGLARLKDREVSAKKLITHPQETPA